MEPASPEKQMVPLLKELDKGQKQKLYDKLEIFERGYTLGVASYTITLCMLMRAPQYFWLWHLFKGFVFIPWRFYRFWKRDMEWYLMDFCYFVSYYSIIGCALAFVRVFFHHASPVAPYNYQLMRAGFSFANGALVMAVPLFGNKIVFHDVDNTTSLYIHLSPALFFWTLRWGGGYGTSLIEQTWPGMFHICQDMAEGDLSVTWSWQALWCTSDCQGTVSQFALWPALAWIFLWGIPYYLVTFCCFKKFLADRPQKQYLYRDTLKDTKGQGRLIAKAPERLQPVAFMLQHFAWVILSGFCSIILWNSFVLHTAFLCCIFALAVHNGSSFMFRIVAARTVQHKLHKTLEADNKGAGSHESMG